MDNDHAENYDENYVNGLQRLATGRLPEGAMLIGWVTAAEWIDPEGKRILTMMDGSADGQRLPEWQRDGYLLSGLKGGWGDPVSPGDSE